MTWAAAIIADDALYSFAKVKNHSNQPVPVRRSGLSIEDMTVTRCGDSMARVDRLKNGKHHSGHFSAPDATRTIVIFTSGHRTTNGPFSGIIIHGDFRVIQENSQSCPVLLDQNIHQGSVRAQHLDCYLDEFTFRFNRWASQTLGLRFYRLLQQSVVTSPVSYQDIVRSGKHSI